MSWYEDAGMAISEALNLPTVEGYDENAEKIAAIIAKHDPNRWVPVGEALPPVREHIEFVHSEEIFPGQMWGGPVFAADNGDVYQGGVTHWRPINLPEVKE